MRDGKVVSRSRLGVVIRRAGQCEAQLDDRHRASRLRGTYAGRSTCWDELQAEGCFARPVERVKMTVSESRVGVEQTGATDISLRDLKLRAAPRTAPTVAPARPAYRIAPRARRAHENIHGSSKVRVDGRVTANDRPSVRGSEASTSSGPCVSVPQVASSGKARFRLARLSPKLRRAAASAGVVSHPHAIHNME